MSHTVLLQKLIAIEESIGVESGKEVRYRLQDAQEYLLTMQRETAEAHRLEVNWDPALRFNFARQ